MVEIKYKDVKTLETIINKELNNCEFNQDLSAYYLDKLYYILKNTEESLNKLEHSSLYAYEFAPKEEYKQLELRKYHKVLDHQEEVKELLALIEPKLKDLEKKEGQDLIFYKHLKHK